MNEEALKVLYSLAKKDGYQKDFKDFIKLMSSNEKAVDQMYGLARSDGYKKELPDFQILVGLKKKTNPNLLFKRTLRYPLHQWWWKILSYRSLQRQ